MRLLPPLFVAFGAVWLSFSAIFVYGDIRFATTAQRAEGVVISLTEKMSTSKRTGKTYAPVVKFKTSDGTEIEFESKTSTNPPAYGIGEKVRVIFNPKDTARTEIYSFMSFWFGDLVFVSIGFVIILFGLNGSVLWMRKIRDL